MMVPLGPELPAFSVPVPVFGVGDVKLPKVISSSSFSKLAYKTQCPSAVA